MVACLQEAKVAKNLLLGKFAALKSGTLVQTPPQAFFGHSSTVSLDFKQGHFKWGCNSIELGRANESAFHVKFSEF